MAAITGGNIGQGFLTGAISGAIFGGVGFGVGHLGIKGLGITAAHMLGGAASGAINGSITGDNIGMNALISGISAGASQWMGASVPFLKDSAINGMGDMLTNTVRHAAIGAVVGGGISAALGGYFGDGARQGAMTSAIAYNANCLQGILIEQAIEKTFLLVAAAVTILSSPQTRTNVERAIESLAVHFARGKSAKTNGQQNKNSSAKTKEEIGYYNNKDLRYEGEKMGLGYKGPNKPPPHFRSNWHKAFWIAERLTKLFNNLSGQ